MRPDIRSARLGVMRFPRFMRAVLDPVTERIPVPILGGLNRGRLWSLASSGSGYGTGRRAHEQMALLRSLLAPGHVFWDVGAHHGYVTLMASAAVGGGGAVHAFEPGSRNGRMLRRHLSWNRVHNATAHSVALGAFEGEASFGGGYTSKMQALGQGSERVTVRTGAAMVGASGAVVEAPDVVKIDVEGAEGDVLRGVMEILPTTASLVIAVHSPEADEACAEVLAAHAFQAWPTPELAEARANPDGWPGDPDLVAVGPEGALPPEARERLADP